MMAEDWIPVEYSDVDMYTYTFLEPATEMELICAIQDSFSENAFQTNASDIPSDPTVEQLASEINPINNNIRVASVEATCDESQLDYSPYGSMGYEGLTYGLPTEGNIGVANIPTTLTYNQNEHNLSAAGTTTSQVASVENVTAAQTTENSIVMKCNRKAITTVQRTRGKQVDNGESSTRHTSALIPTHVIDMERDEELLSEDMKYNWLGKRPFNISSNSGGDKKLRTTENIEIVQDLVQDDCMQRKHVGPGVRCIEGDDQLKIYLPLPQLVHSNQPKESISVNVCALEDPRAVGVSTDPCTRVSSSTDQQEVRITRMVWGGMMDYCQVKYKHNIRKKPWKSRASSLFYGNDIRKKP